MYKLSLVILCVFGMSVHGGHRFAAPRSLLSSAVEGSGVGGWPVNGVEGGGGAERVCVCVCSHPHSVVVLVVIFTLLDAIAVLLLLVLLLRVGDVPLWVVVQHGLGLVDLQLGTHKDLYVLAN